MTTPEPETDVRRLLHGMQPHLHAERLVFVSVPPDVAEPAVRTLVRVAEDEGTTLVLPADDVPPGLAAAFPCARITLEVHSSLEAVGFLAAVTAALADAGIGANPVSGFHHDHVFVPYDARHRALDVLLALSAGR